MDRHVVWKIRQSTLGRRFISENLHLISEGFRADRILAGKIAIGRLIEGLERGLKKSTKTVTEGPDGRTVQTVWSKENNKFFIDRCLEISGVRQTAQERHVAREKEKEAHDQAALLEALKSNEVINDAIQDVIDAAGHKPESQET